MNYIRKAVERAISSIHGDPDILMENGLYPWQYCTKAADAAMAAHIEAIMEPSEAMARAGYEAMEQDGSVTQIWQAILTAMRTPKP